MQTRSQTSKVLLLQNQEIYTPKPIYEVNIDFDTASQAWKSNKKYIGNGHYLYVCEYITKKGTNCKRNPKHGLNFCCLHSNKK